MKSRLFRMLSRVLLISIFTSQCLLTADDAMARAGRGRSMGRSSSFGSRSASPNNYRQQNTGNHTNPSQMAKPQRGGFMRNLAGGLAGGFLGSMLFSSMSHGAGMGGFGGGNGGGGGLGFLELLLIGGLVVFGIRWWRQRQQNAYDVGNGVMARRMAEEPYRSIPTQETQQALPGNEIDPEEASDIFFKIQAAWTRRELAPVLFLLGREMQAILGKDLEDLRRSQRINRLENISVRKAEVKDNWYEDGTDYCTVRFLANLLDYTVEEQSGRIVEGSDTHPEKFEEEWTFAKSAHSGNWQLVGIQQL